MRSTDPTWDRWTEVDRIFAAALERDTGEREAFVAERCGGDVELQETVLALLSAERDSRGLFEAPKGATTRAALHEVAARTRLDTAAAPERVGPYRILREIGRGGMGSVYLAERADVDFEQRVAVKLLRRGLDTDDVVRRFVAERRILAGLAHPNIARLFDGGSTEDGRPYLVLEHVAGERITDYCDARRLDIRQRLDLFLRVCEAVRYAHTQLVVHRDLKPSNILVTAEGRVKLLDFGIAKIVGGEAADEEPLTRPGVRELTPEYASPEQRRGQPITTASDVYQLGTLLFVLLTGRRPVDRPRVPGPLPIRPSSVFGGDDDDAAAARDRGASPEKLRRTLRGDLDTIVLKALREEPDRRYGSVDRLTDDLRRHLDGSPVSARPDTLAYRAGKFLRRHRWLAPAAAAGLLFLALYIASSVRYTAQLERERNAARAEAERATEVQDFLVDLFRSADPFEPADEERGRRITVVEALDLGAERVLAELADRPRIQASLLGALADVYSNLGAHRKAVPLAERALAVHERTAGAGSAQYRAALARLATALYFDSDSALALYRRRLQATLRAKGTLDPEVAEARVDLADHLRQVFNRLAEAEAEYRRVLAIADSAAVAPAELAGANRGLAEIYTSLGRPAEAEPHARRAVELDTEAFGEASPTTAIAHESLAKVLGALGRTGEADAEFARAVAILESTLGPQHGNTLNARNNLALLRRRTGNLAGAEQALRQLVEAQKLARGAGHFEVGSTYQNLATVLADQGRLEEAADFYARAAAIYERELDAGNYLRAWPHVSLADIELRRGRPRAAESHARRALRILEATLPPGHYATAVARCRAGRALAAQGRIAEALPHLRAAARALPEGSPVPAYREECLEALGALESASR